MFIASVLFGMLLFVLDIVFTYWFSYGYVYVMCRINDCIYSRTGTSHRNIPSHSYQMFRLFVH